MKKFITTSPRQDVHSIKGQKVEIGTYKAINNPAFDCDIKTPYPIIPMLYGSTAVGDSVEVLVITAEADAKDSIDDVGYLNCKDNLNYLSEEISSLSKERGFNAKITPIRVPLEETTENHLQLFEDLIEKIDDEDEIFCDITYGAKTTPIVEMMLLNYAYQCKNCSIGAAVYGAAHFNKKGTGIEKSKEIYDVTQLIIMDQIVNTVAKGNFSEPLEIIRGILNTKKELYGTEG